MKIFHVDAFTGEPFKGNPAGVCILENGDLDDDTKKKLAGELKHSETAFLLAEDGGYNLRWFTPEREVNLCGHATLAAAHVLWERGTVDRKSPIRFRTRSGELTAIRRGDVIELDFPRISTDPCEDNVLVNRALGISPLHTRSNEQRYLIEIESPDALRAMVPDFGLLQAAEKGAFIITSRSDRPGFDFLSRFFAPYAGVPEDPVTGSAHCCLAPYWAAKLGKNRLVGFQESKRTGAVECELAGEDRVLLRGRAVTVIEGELRL